MLWQQVEVPSSPIQVTLEELEQRLATVEKSLAAAGKGRPQGRRAARKAEWKSCCAGGEELKQQRNGGSAGLGIMTMAEET